MTTEVPTKLRLVRCPKCRKVLPELPNIPVYQCGGCGTILQAKRRKNNINDGESLDHGTDRSQKIDQKHISEDKEARRSNQEELSSADKSEIERNRKQTGEIEVSSELPQDLAKEEGVQDRETRLSDGAASSIELDHQHASAESSPVSEAHSAMNEDMNSSPRDSQPDPNRKQPGDSNISNEVVSSTEVDHQESEGRHRQIGGSINYPEQNTIRDEDINVFRSREQPEDVNFSDQVASSTEFNHQRSERSSVDTNSLNEEDENQDFVEESKRDDESDFGGRGREHRGTLKISGEISSLADKVDGITNSSEQCSTRDEDSNTYSNRKQPGDADFPDELVPSSAELNHFQSERSSLDSKTQSEKDENKDRSGLNSGSNGIDVGGWKREYHGAIDQGAEELSPVTGPATELDLKLKRPVSSESWSDNNLLSSVANRFSSESFSTDGLMSPHNEHTAQDQSRPRQSWSDENLLSGSSRSSIPHRFSGESFLTDSLMSPRNEHMEEDHSRDFNGNEGVSSTYTSENLALHNSSSEFTARQRHVPKSRTNSINYAYEGSVSSSDESEDLVSLRRVHLYERELKAAEAGSTKTAPKKDEGVDKIRSSFPSMQPHGRNSSSVSPENNRRAARSNLAVGTPRQDEPETLPRNALPGGSRTRFRTDEGRSKLPPYSKSHRGGYDDGNHLKHARKELNRRVGSASSKRPEDLEKEKIELLKMVFELQNELKRTHISQAPEAGTCRDLSHARSAFSCNQGRRPFHARDSRIPFSAEATIRRRPEETYCSHCSPQDWQFQPLQPPHSCCNRAQSSLFDSGRRSHNLHRSGTPSPRHYATSEASDDLWHRDREANRIRREKTQSAKRHVRPVFGGAPLVACYKCFELLQLPADFLLFRRRIHQLQCGGCSAILKFSLHRGTQIVPYKVYTADVDAVVAPPPSEVDAFSDANVRTKLDSDDYGPPRSYSTEAEPNPSQARSNGRTISSGSSYEPSNERKEESLLKGLGKKIYSHAGTFSSAGSSSKSSKQKRASSEMQEASGSPLHKLMGYASPSKVMER